MPPPARPRADTFDAARIPLVTSFASGADVKIVQARLRHASATTTLDCYGHLWPDRDESTRAAVDAVLTARLADSADSVRTTAGPR